MSASPLFNVGLRPLISNSQLPRRRLLPQYLRRGDQITFQSGSPNIMAVAGLNAALKWMHRIGIDNVFKAEHANHAHLLEVLRSFDNIKVFQPTNVANFVGVVSCVFDGCGSNRVGQMLSEKGIAVRTGLHCAPGAHRLLGTLQGGTVRFSVSYFNTDSDFEMLRAALEFIKQQN